MPSIKVKENEPFDIAIRRFRRACEKAGILTEIRKREFYEKPTPQFANVKLLQLLKEYPKDQTELQTEDVLSCTNLHRPTYEFRS